VIRYILQKSIYKPLFYDDGQLVFSKGNKIYKLNHDGSETKLFSIPVNFITKFLLLFRLAIRLFRLEVYAATSDSEHYFICYLGKLYSYNLVKKELKVEMNFFKGHGPLSFANIQGIKGFKDSIYFGDYFSDGEFDCIKIYARDESGHWRVCYTFEGGLINHIHALVPDSMNNCIWILTGDYGPSYGIYMASDDFLKVDPVLIGDQQYRSCVAYPFNGGLLYATDSHLESNSIRLLSYVGDKWASTHIADINGPVIYGCELLDYYIFATSVEPGLVKSNLISTLMDRQKGAGIIENQVEILAVKKGTTSVIRIEQNPKDWLPARLFQFGSAMFPSNSLHTNVLATYYTATSNREGQTEFIDVSQSYSKG
jgi:outer membrane protein assembly factor BamB